MMENEQEPARARLLRSARVLKAYFENKLKISLELLTEEPAQPLDDGLQFDMRINDWGIWGLRSSAPLTEKTQSEISSMFHSLWGAMDSLDSRRQDLSRLERKFETVGQELPSNVIPIGRARKTIAWALPDKRWSLKMDCLIESDSADDIHRMAVELHSHSRRYAFLEFHDLQADTRVDAAELAKLGSVTLFVPSILSLSREEQEALRQLIDIDADERPLLMVGAQRSYSDLRTEPAINVEFLVLLARAYLKLSRPFSEYKKQGLIHYFLDSLTESPT